MPKPRPVARNADRNPNLGAQSMPYTKSGEMKPYKKSPYMAMAMSPGGGNSIRAKNQARIAKQPKRHTPR